MDEDLLPAEARMPPIARLYRATSRKDTKTCFLRPARMTRRRPVMILLLFLHLLVAPCMAVRKNHYVHWNTSNPIFRIDNTDHIIDVNEGNQPWEYDQVNIICPLYERGARPEAIETYIIYSVDKEEFDSCRITNPNPRVIAQCTKPHELMYFTITFRSFTPTPGGMEFRPGKDYYFISTSAHGDVHRRVGGRCSTHNMRVQFKVASNTYESTTEAAVTTQPPPRAVNIPRSTSGSAPPPSPSTTRPRTTGRGSLFGYREKLPRYDHSYYANSRGRGDGSREDFYGGDIYYRRHNSRGRKNKYPVSGSGVVSSHPNDVIKHEASRMAAAASSSSPLPAASFSLLAASLLVMTLLNAAAGVTRPH